MSITYAHLNKLVTSARSACQRSGQRFGEGQAPHTTTVTTVVTQSTWWSATTARTLEPTFELKVQRRGATECETLKLAPSGELFELSEEIRQTTAAFRERRALVWGAEARKRILVCLEAERSLREERELPLQF
jgi:hypothetical protein